MKVRLRCAGSFNTNAFHPERGYGWMWYYILYAENGLIAEEYIPGNGRGQPFDDNAVVELPDEDWKLELTNWDDVYPDEDEVYL